MIDGKLTVKHIYQEQLFATNKPSEIVTILGSCISVCLWDEKFKVAGMNHYVMPLWNGDGLKTLRYGNISIMRLVDEMLKCGAVKKNFVAKIFGGAAINIEQGFGVGAQNIKVAKDMLSDFGIPIIASDIGSNKGRKIILSSVDGSVFVKYSI